MAEGGAAAPDAGASGEGSADGGAAQGEAVAEAAAAPRKANPEAPRRPEPDSAAAPAGLVREGSAEVLPTRQEARKDGKAEVFYNPAQVFNRDLSVLVLSVFARLRAADVEERRQRKELRCQTIGKPLKAAPPPGLVVLEALAATGIRSIRYAKELSGRGAEGIRHIVANDLDPTATAHIRRNLEHNQVPAGLVEVTCEDANGHMYARRARGAGGHPEDAYDVIDIDPYGTASPFLDAAVQAVADGGLLCITSTDMPVLAGNNPETCFARYGGSALKAGYVHEMSLRLVLHAVATSAARYGREAQPLLSCSIDFYVRVFVRIHDSAARAKRLASKTAVVHQCVQCETFAVQPLGEAATEENSTKFKPARVIVHGAVCPECGGRVKLGGPFHSGPLHDPDFVRRCLEACEEGARGDLPFVTSWRKVEGLLTAISEEHADLALYYRLPQLCKGLKLPPVPLRQFRGTLIALGYRASHFHREPEAVKTDAPSAVVYDLMRLWAEEHPREKPPLPELLRKEFTLKRPIEWSIIDEGAPKSKIARFLPNPEPNWGPKPRARGRAGPGAGDGGAGALETGSVPAAGEPAAAAAPTEASGGPAAHVAAEGATGSSAVGAAAAD